MKKKSAGSTSAKKISRSSSVKAQSMSRILAREVKSKKTSGRGTLSAGSKRGKKGLSVRRSTEAAAGKNFMQLGQEIWPIENNVLFRPDRVKYVRKLIQPQGCVFCAAASHAGPKAENLSVYMSNHSMVVLNKFPYNSGHLLVLPRRHEGDILNLSQEEYMDLQSTLRLAIEAVKAVYAPPGFNMGLNHGAVAGAGIPEHLHFHLIPRWAGDLNFFPLIAQTKVVIESLEQTYEKYFNFFNGKK